MKAVIFWVTFLLLLFTSFNTKANNTQIILCDWCTLTSQFESMALYNGAGDYIIVNITGSVAKKFKVRVEGNDLLSVQMALPSGFLTDLAKVTALQQAFDNLTNFYGITPYTANFDLSKPSLFNDLSNGCGIGEAWSITNVSIPDFPFATACQNHDLCYSSNSPKNFCDSQFYYDMGQDIDYILEQMELLTEFAEILVEIVLESQRAIYYYAVVNSERALQRYCESTQNVTDPNCVEPDPVPPSGTFSHLAEELRALAGSNYNSNTGTIVATCEIWAFPNGFGGSYFLERNCTYRYLP